MLEIYFLTLSTELKPEKIEALIPIALSQTDFWPSPARLLRLAGVPNREERIETEAAHALERVMLEVAKVARDDLKRRRLVDEIEATAPNERTTRALRIFGGGDLNAAMILMSQHPRLKRSDDEREGLGLELSSIEKLERRWLNAWKETENK